MKGATITIGSIWRRRRTPAQDGHDRLIVARAGESVAGQCACQSAEVIEEFTPARLHAEFIRIK